MQTFNIKASEKGNAKITYKSDNKLVKVNLPGRITLSPNYIRSAIITISASATDTYEVATKKITVTVMAARLTILKVENDKKKVAAHNIC